MLILCRRNAIKDVKPLPHAPVIIVANHMSHYDIICLALATYPLKISYMAKDELFNTWFLRNFFLRMGAFPVRRGESDRRALRRANEVLNEANWSLGIFPEGGRSREAKLIRGHVGPALIALRNDVLIVPAGISGTDEIKKRTRSLSGLLRRPLVTVHLGQPFKLPQAEGKLTKEHLERCTDIIMGHVAELLPEKYRGVYGGQ